MASTTHPGGELIRRVVNMKSLSIYSFSLLSPCAPGQLMDPVPQGNVSIVRCVNEHGGFLCTRLLCVCVCVCVCLCGGSPPICIPHALPPALHSCGGTIRVCCWPSRAGARISSSTSPTSASRTTRRVWTTCSLDTAR